MYKINDNSRSFRIQNTDVEATDLETLAERLCDTVLAWYEDKKSVHESLGSQPVRITVGGEYSVDDSDEDPEKWTFDTDEIIGAAGHTDYVGSFCELSEISLEQATAMPRADLVEAILVEAKAGYLTDLEAAKESAKLEYQEWKFEQPEKEIAALGY